MQKHTIIKYSLAALVVIILGAFSGWYFFLHARSQATVAVDAARGYGASATPGAGSASATQPPSFLSRMLSTITGGGTGVSLPPSSPSFGQEGGSFGASAPVDIEPPAPQTKRPPQLWHVQSKPVAGMAFVKDAAGERLRYVERATGYVYEADAETGIVTRITNTLAPKTYEAIVAANGKVIQRSLDDAGRVLSSAWTITASSSAATTSAHTLSSVDLPRDITRITADPRTGALFYLINDASGVGGFRSEWSGAKPKRVFASLMTNWHPFWLSDGRIILAQAAADGMPGYAYELVADGALHPLVRGVPGLTMLPRASGALIFGESAGGRLALFAQVKPTATAVQLPIKTIADKCAWTSGKDLVAYCGVPQGLVARNFLDDWYRGAVHSSDALWRVDASAGSAELVYTPEPRTSIDVENPTIDSTGSYIAFMNSGDGSLWVLRIEK